MFKEKINVPIEKLYPILIYNFVTEQMPSKKNYDDRLLWQKIGYIAQQLGASLDEYTFNWYKAGPYSPGYTSLLYSLSNSLDEVPSEYTLSDFAESKLAPLKIIFENKPIDLSVSKWFELVASILYISKDIAADKNSCLKRLVRKKPFFDNQEINNHAWGILEKLDML